MPRVSVLFVCLGNICRSPMAESIFREKVRRADLEDEFHIESAGTGDWHVGENPDPRTVRTLCENGIGHFSQARQVRSRDFEAFDYLVAMDHQNVADLRRWPGTNPDKISLMLSWNPQTKGEIVPDPYYGDLRDFTDVYRLLDEAADHLLLKLSENHQIGRTREA